MASQVKLFFRTIRYYKSEQLFYQFYYALRNQLRAFFNYKYLFNLYRKGLPLKFDEFIPAQKSYDANKFTFLNQSVRFSDKIDWEYADKGKLWTNHLSYFDYLLQEDMSKARGSALMYLMIDHLPKSTIAKTPYSLSVRGINWIKFISKHEIARKTVDRYLYCQYRILMDNIAYDRMGNHLLENGFSMLFGAYYFKGYELFNEAKILLIKELYEQILADGAHFQLSPMYHQIMLNRILDCYNLMKNNDVYHDAKLKDLLKVSAQKMLGWLRNMTYSNGHVPCLNDSTYNVAPTSQQLFDYAKRLEIKEIAVPLSASGYRKINSGKMEGIIDVGNIGPYYQTTHAHADTFNFELLYEGVPFIVDTGVSTYSSNNIRQKERSTFSHNTVRVAGIEQSEMHGSFRVGRRAKANILIDEPDHIVAEHDGYQKWGIVHQRSFRIEGESLTIEDELTHDLESLPKSSAFIHFHPKCEITNVGTGTVEIGKWIIKIKGHIDIKVLDYNFAEGFNITTKAKMLQIDFLENLSTSIYRRSS